MFENGKYYITLNDENHEVSKEVHDAFYQEYRHEKYLIEKDQSHNMVLLNISGLEEIEGGTEQIAFASPTPSHEEMMIAKEIHDALHHSIELLPRNEQALIQAIYFEDDTEASYAKKAGLSQPAVHKQKKRILEKLKTIMNKLESFSELVIFFF